MNSHYNKVKYSEKYFVDFMRVLNVTFSDIVSVL